MSIGLRMAVNTQKLSSLAHCLSELLENFLRIIPPDAGVCDADTVLEASLAFWWHLL